MLTRSRQILIGCCALLFSAGILAAQIPPPQPVPKIDPPAKDAIAARVNGQPIPELAVYRSLTRVPPARLAEARKEVLNFLVDNMIVDQYLTLLKIPVDAKDIDEHMKKVKDEAVKQKKDFNEVLKEALITEDELRTHLASSLRWDKFVLQQGTDSVLQQFFTGNVEMFNGTKLRARHILVPAAEGATKVLAIKKQIESEVTLAVAKVPATADAITREKERTKALEKAFADAAVKDSTCPSKKDGGDLGDFPRAGAMVEPFARAAFALKPYQMSDPVSTEFGVHLILAVEFKPGKDVKFEQVKPFVQEVYSARLREAVLTAYRAKSKIEILERK